MTQLKIILISIILLTLLAGCAQSGPGSANEGLATPAESPQGNKMTSERVVSVAISPTEIPAGGSAEAVVRVTVQPGFHINANPPSYSYLRATELEIGVTEQISIGFIKYPNPINKKFAFAEKPLDVYEADSSLTVLLKAAKSAPKGKQSLSGILRIQACDDQVCYPPGSIAVLVPVIIR